MSRLNDRQMSDELSSCIGKAEVFLWDEMGKLGLKREDGWSIAQMTRDIVDGTEVVLRPIHLRRSAPIGLECVVLVSETKATLETHCISPFNP